MKTLDELIMLAEEKGLKVVETPLQSVSGMLADQTIFLDPSLSNREMRCVLAEEIGHYMTGGGDTVQSKNPCNIRWTEGRAMKVAMELLLDWHQAVRLFCEGQSVADVAEHFDVPVHFMEAAVKRWGFYG
ncbi:MAG: hypothetical protein QM296_09935 [Bacillota bacterium]|nr:hypothetical protein [Bacillota bacterium]